MEKVYQYFDYRKYLSDYISEKKSEKEWYSLRYFASKIRIPHSNLIVILQGKRHVSKTIMENIIKFLKMNRKEAGYFRTLVKFNKAKKAADADRAFTELNAIKNICFRKLEPQQHEYYSKWYYTAVFNLLYYYDFRGDYRDLASQIFPQISIKEAKESIKLLLKLNLIYIDKTGRYRQSDMRICPGKAIRPVVIRRYQDDTMKVARNALQNLAPEFRDISTMSVTVSKDDMEKIMELTRRYKQNLREIVDESSSPDSVYQINMQMFPLTKRKWRLH